MVVCLFGAFRICRVEPSLCMIPHVKLLIRRDRLEVMVGVVISGRVV